MKNELLFTYGTLQDPEVQQAVFGRTVKGEPDLLPGYRKFQVSLWAEVYPMIAPDPTAMVEGLVVLVSTQELALIDEYETEAYQRVRVVLASGRETWVYQQARDLPATLPYGT